MKKIAFLFALAAAIVFSTVENTQAQSKSAGTYLVVEVGSGNTDAYLAAIDAADFTRFRRQDEQRILVFDNGMQIALLSGTELAAKGIPFRADHLDASTKDLICRSVFALHPMGHLIEQVPMRVTDKQATLNRK